jgi:hypothetical protein
MASLIAVPIGGALYVMLIAVVATIALSTRKPIRRRTAMLILGLLLPGRNRG